MSKKNPDINSSKPVKDKSRGKVTNLANQVDTITADLMRERADFTNYKRRSELDKLQLMSQAKSELLTQILPIFDDLERALVVLPPELNDNGWVKGVQQVHRQVQAKLVELGVTRIPAVGQAFDPRLHEAIGFEDDGGVEEVVIEELRPGYKLGAAVLRPSMVRVGASKPNPEDTT